MAAGVRRQWQIQFSNVSKSYRLGDGGSRAVSAFARLMRRSGGGASPQNPGVHWALRDVTFAVASGEVVGMIGRNGAGKTTCLKLLTRVTSPTSGSVGVVGRVAALIELGAGFHPDLTGRQNIYLNGAVLGLSRKAVNERFDRIVEFAGIGEYLDTPVKRYSSGMYVRLGFAVAAHVDCDVLVVDEVLAVGDVDFQTRCYRRIRELRSSGTTIVLVSHNMDLIRMVCDRALMFADGELVAEGSAKDVTDMYLASGLSVASEAESRRDPNRPIVVQSVEIVGSGQRGQARTGDAVRVRVGGESRVSQCDVVFSVSFYSLDGVLVTGQFSDNGEMATRLRQGRFEVELSYAEFGLLPGVYEMSIAVLDARMMVPVEWHHRAYRLEVKSGSHGRGLVWMPHQWRTAGAAIDCVVRREHL